MYFLRNKSLLFFIFFFSKGFFSDLKKKKVSNEKYFYLFTFYASNVYFEINPYAKHALYF